MRAFAVLAAITSASRVHTRDELAIDAEASANVVHRAVALLQAQNHIRSFAAPGAMCRLMVHAHSDPEDPKSPTMCDMAEQLTFDTIGTMIQSAKIPGVTEACNADNIKRICAGEFKVGCGEFLDQMLDMMKDAPTPPDTPAEIAANPKPFMCMGLVADENMQNQITEAAKAGGVTCAKADFVEWC